MITITHIIRRRPSFVCMEAQSLLTPSRQSVDFHNTPAAHPLSDYGQGFLPSLGTRSLQDSSHRHRTRTAGYLEARSSCTCCLALCLAMNRPIAVNSYTMLASIIMIAIATKLVVLITALLFSQTVPALHGKSHPA